MSTISKKDRSLKKLLFITVIKYSITLNLYKSDKLSEEKIEQIIRTIVK